MKPVVFHSEAEWELHQASRHYEKQRAGLGREFRQEVESAVQRILQNPRAFPVHDNEGTRRSLVRRFPYTVFFVELHDVLWVAAVAHHRRRPQYWSGRRPE